MLAAMRSKGVRQTTKYKGPLTIGDLKINVNVFTKSDAKALPSLKKRSLLSDDPKKADVKMSRTYYLKADGPDNASDRERVRAFR